MQPCGLCWTCSKSTLLRVSLRCVVVKTPDGETRGSPIESKFLVSPPANNGPKAHYGRGVKARAPTERPTSWTF